MISILICSQSFLRLTCLPKVELAEESPHGGWLFAG